VHVARTRTDPARTYGGRTAIVTGGASGIGLALGAQLVAAGGHVVLADIDGDGADRRAEELTTTGPAGGSVVGRHLDVTDEASFRVLVHDVVERHGRLDLLVNNAGVSLGGPTHEMTSAHWQRVIDINLRGVVNGVLAAYPQMVEQGDGQIVNTASGAGLVGLPYVAAYSATKHAVVGLSTAMRPEAALHGVRVGVLCPGAVETAALDASPPADLPRGATEPVTPRAYLAVVRQEPVPAEQFARLALRSMAADKAVIVVPRRARSLWYLHRLSPGLTRLATAMVARRVRRRLIQPASPRPGRATRDAP
jgi:NAD(P)-dependent dehydrogenase (short-subunit alcohol dehydrogenase family)